LLILQTTVILFPSLSEYNICSITPNQQNLPRPAETPGFSVC
jgi:hypothetical protein